MRLVNVKYDRFTAYIGRRLLMELHRTGETDGIFGNPFQSGTVVPPHYNGYPLMQSGLWVESMGHALSLYRDYLHERLAHDELFRERFDELMKDDVLGCWCKGPTGQRFSNPFNPPCHGDIIIEVWEERRRGE